MPQPTVIVLAAGRGARCAQSGGTTRKLDALLSGVPVLQRVLRTLEAAGLPCHVVRHSAGGKGDSIAQGVAATAQAPGWLVLPGDLGLVAAPTPCLVAQGLASWPVVQPVCLGQRGHPVGFALIVGYANLLFGRDCSGRPHQAAACRIDPRLVELRAIARARPAPRTRQSPTECWRPARSALGRARPGAGGARAGN